MLDVLHWFPLQQRISYLGLAPDYLRDLCRPAMGIPGRHSLRSTEQGLLLVAFAHTATMQNRAFSVVGPSLWNVLSLALRLFPRIVSNSFYTHLKTFLFGRTGIGSAPDRVVALKERYRNYVISYCPGSVNPPRYFGKIYASACCTTVYWSL